MPTKFCYSIDNLPTGPLSPAEEVHLPLPPDASPHVKFVSSYGAVGLDLGHDKNVVLPINLWRLHDYAEAKPMLERLAAEITISSQVEITARSRKDHEWMLGLMVEQVLVTVLLALDVHQPKAYFWANEAVQKTRESGTLGHAYGRSRVANLAEGYEYV